MQTSQYHRHIKGRTLLDINLGQRQADIIYIHFPKHLNNFQGHSKITVKGLGIVFRATDSQAVSQKFESLAYQAFDD